jgi:hypothetical protein
MKTSEVMKALGTTKSYTYVLMSKARTSYQKQYGETIEERMTRLREMGKRLALARTIETPPAVVGATPDTVNHPPHYKVGGIETIDFIEAKKLNYNIGNVVKYLTRADHKGNKLEDLRKAQWYLTREIETLK